MNDIILIKTLSWRHTLPPLSWHYTHLQTSQYMSLYRLHFLTTVRWAVKQTPGSIVRIGIYSKLFSHDSRWIRCPYSGQPFWSLSSCLSGSPFTTRSTCYSRHYSLRAKKCTVKLEWKSMMNFQERIGNMQIWYSWKFYEAVYPTVYSIGPTLNYIVSQFIFSVQVDYLHRYASQFSWEIHVWILFLSGLRQAPMS